MTDYTPDESTEELYTWGSCHIFALACAREMDVTGYLVVFDPDEIHWHGDDGGDDIHAVVHVYALLLRDGEDIAVDVTGERPARDVAGICEEMFGAPPGLQDVVDEEGLRALADTSEGSGERPLHEIDEADIAEAQEDLRALLVSAAPEI